jgi:hypothetical protein
LDDPPSDAGSINEQALAEAMLSVARDQAGWRRRASDIRAHARATLAPHVIASSYADALRTLAHDAKGGR